MLILTKNQRIKRVIIINQGNKKIQRITNCTLLLKLKTLIKCPTVLRVFFLIIMV